MVREKENCVEGTELKSSKHREINESVLPFRCYIGGREEDCSTKTAAIYWNMKVFYICVES